MGAFTDATAHRAHWGTLSALAELIKGGSPMARGVRGEERIAELCRREGNAWSMYYSWSKLDSRRYKKLG